MYKNGPALAPPAEFHDWGGVGWGGRDKERREWRVACGFPASSAGHVIALADGDHGVDGNT